MCNKFDILTGAKGQKYTGLYLVFSARSATARCLSDRRSRASYRSRPGHTSYLTRVAWNEVIYLPQSHLHILSSLIRIRRWQPYHFNLFSSRLQDLYWWGKLSKLSRYFRYPISLLITRGRRIEIDQSWSPPSSFGRAYFFLHRWDEISNHKN